VSIELTLSEWQTKHILINPPSFAAPIAVEILDLQKVLEMARLKQN
jgi:hypothetical protein